MNYQSTLGKIIVNISQYFTYFDHEEIYIRIWWSIDTAHYKDIVFYFIFKKMHSIVLQTQLISFIFATLISGIHRNSSSSTP